MLRDKKKNIFIFSYLLFFNEDNYEMVYINFKKGVSGINWKGQTLKYHYWARKSNGPINLTSPFGVFNQIGLWIWSALLVPALVNETHFIVIYQV